MNTIAQRTSLAEATTAGALVGWIARARTVQEPGTLAAKAAQAGAPPGIVEAIKASVPAASVGEDVGLAGASAAVSAFVNATAEQSVLLRLMADSALLRVPLRTRLLALGSDASAAVVGEGQPIPLQAFQWETNRIEDFKIAALVALSNEAWHDISSAGQSFVNTKLREAVAQVADVQFFDRILTAGTPALDAPSGDAVAILFALRDMLDAIHVRPGARLHWAVSTGAANALATIDTTRTDLNPFSGSLLGLPATITLGLTGRSLVLLDGRGIAGDVVSLKVEQAREATLQMRDDPTNNSATPTATTLVSLWQTGATAVKCILTLGFEPIRDVSAAALTLTDAP